MKPCKKASSLFIILYSLYYLLFLNIFNVFHCIFFVILFVTDIRSTSRYLRHREPASIDRESPSNGYQ